jgi:UDP-N-acetylmuramoylalanine--D-glutamate ligase
MACARFLRGRGAHVTITDRKEKSDFDKDFFDLLPDDCELLLGEQTDFDPADYDSAVISPGVPWDSPVAEAVRCAGVELISEIELAYRNIEAPFIAVTGSNGKSTTTTMIGHVLTSAGASVYVGGNLGTPLIEALEINETYDFIVAEVSSFQLEGIKDFRPHVALFLNASPDHLDRHGSIENYLDAKNRVFENQKKGDVLIVDGEDPFTSAIEANDGVTLLKFSIDYLGYYGAWVKRDMAVAQIGPDHFDLFHPEELAVLGRHNLKNALAASLAVLSAKAAGVEHIRNGILDFPGLPHRTEHVAEIDGVSFYNDSKGTNVDATVKTLENFDKNVVLIAGGKSKGTEFTQLVHAVRERAKGIVLIGETADEILENLGNFQPKIKAVDMDEAVAKAFAWCGPTDAVILSPSCSSFDMYENFEARGEAFIKAVLKLAKERSENAG